jgi:hypothetical protein
MIINFDSLLDFCVENMKCRVCRGSLECGSFHLESAGIASAITYFCAPCRNLKRLDTMKKSPNTWLLESPLRHGNSPGKITNEPNPLSQMSPLELNEINVQFVLAKHNLGVGRSCANTLLGVLSMSHKAFYCYSNLEESIAAEQITLGEDILDQNLKDELDETVYCTEKNYWYASLSIDCGWLKKAGGRKYDSAEGHPIFLSAIKRGKLLPPIV